MGNASETVNEFLTAFYTGDFAKAKALVVEDFSFRGPFLQVDGREPFFNGAEGLRPVVRGHRTLHQWEELDEVCSFYELHIETRAGSGSVLMSEWHTVRSGRLASARVVFDTAAFRALVPQR